MKRRKLWRRVLIGVVVLLILYLGIGGWLASGLIHRILTVGAIAAQIEGAEAPDSPYDLGYRGDPAAAFGYAFDDVVIDTPLGGAPAWFVPAQGGPSALWAIYVHGIAGHREDGYRHLSVLHEAGIPTLLITYRNDDGAPRSAEDMYTFGLAEWADLDAAVTYALANGAENVVIAAESMGGGIAGQFLTRSAQTDRVAALFLDAPALDLPATIAYGLRRTGVPLSLGIERIALRLFSIRNPVDLNAALSLDAVASFPRPLFVAHGSGDRIVPVSLSDRLTAERYGVTTYLRTHADHLQSWQEDPDLYRTQLFLFLSQLLPS
ncbi:MAG: alpha/beta hydrolase family protein [Bauldia sp.]